MPPSIFLFAEVRRNGTWETATPLQRNPFELLVEAGEEPEWLPEDLDAEMNTPMYAILGNFGRFRDGAFTTITPPRGFPVDASVGIREYYTTFTEPKAPGWLLLRELIDFDWQQETGTQTAMVEPAVAHLFEQDPSKPPRRFPYAEWPKDIAISYAGWLRDGIHVYWTETHASAVGEAFLNDLLDRLRSYGELDDVRIVFWFD